MTHSAKDLRLQPSECLTCHLGTLGYGEAWSLQQRLHAGRVAGRIPDVLLLLEHPPVYTIGKSGDPKDLLLSRQQLEERGIELYHVDRGGGITYHGPGQLVGYLVMDLQAWGSSVRRFVWGVEEILIRTLASFGVDSSRRGGYPGVWVDGKKIASIGLRVRRWVSMHGFALNVLTDLSDFHGIVPCGLRAVQMTSMEQCCGNGIRVQQVVTRVIEELRSVLGRNARSLERAELEGMLTCGQNKRVCEHESER